MTPTTAKAVRCPKCDRQLGQVERTEAVHQLIAVVKVGGIRYHLDRPIKVDCKCQAHLIMGPLGVRFATVG